MIEHLKRLEQEDPSVKAMVVQRMLANEYRSSLYLTAKQLLGYKDITWATHGPIIQALESHTLRKLLCVPRGCFKSSLGVVAYSIWCLLRNPNERILIDSEVYSNSKNFLREIKAHLENPALTRLFGTFRHEPWSEGEITIAQRTVPLKEASITCGGVETVKVGQHYNRIIMDDLNSGNNSGTEEGRQKVINHYRMNTAILEPGGTMVVIGTRYHSGDIIGWVLENEIASQGLIA